MRADALDTVPPSLVYDFVFPVNKKPTNRSASTSSTATKRKSTEEGTLRVPTKRQAPGKRAQRERDRVTETPDFSFDSDVERMAMEEFELCD